jgi:hypothetical protein
VLQFISVIISVRTREVSFLWYFILTFRLGIYVAVLFVYLVPKKAAYLSQFPSDKFCPLHEYSDEIVTAVGIWPDCRMETNVFCSARHLGVVAGQHASRIGNIVATTTNNKVVDFYFLVWSRSTLLCCVGSGSNVALSQGVGLRPLNC